MAPTQRLDLSLASALPVRQPPPIDEPPSAIAMKPFPLLSYACPMASGELRGDERARFCEKCGLTVTNLSALSDEARAALLARAGTGRLCVSYYRRLTGEYVTPASPLTTEERSRIRQFGVAALSAGALALAAGCMATPPPPTKADPPIVTQSAPPEKPAAAEETVVLEVMGMASFEPPPKPWWKVW
jgi:hypothetical protein